MIWVQFIFFTPHYELPPSFIFLFGFLMTRTHNVRVEGGSGGGGCLPYEQTFCNLVESKKIAFFTPSPTLFVSLRLESTILVLEVEGVYHPSNPFCDLGWKQKKDCFFSSDALCTAQLLISCFFTSFMIWFESNLLPFLFLQCGFLFSRQNWHFELESWIME